MQSQVVVVGIGLVISTTFVCTTFISVIATLVVNSVIVSMSDVVYSFTSGDIPCVFAVTELVKGLLVVRFIANSDNRFDSWTSVFETVGEVCCSVLLLDDSMGLDNCESGVLVVSSLLELMLAVTIMVFGVSVFICERDIVVTSPTSMSAGRVFDSINEIFESTMGPRVELSSLSFSDKSTTDVVTSINSVTFSKGFENSEGVVVASNVPVEIDTDRFLLSFPTVPSGRVSFITSVKRVLAIVINSVSNVSLDDRESFSITESTSREIGVGVVVMVTSSSVGRARVL